MSRGDEVVEDFPPSGELLFPSPPSSNHKASFFFHRNHLKLSALYLYLFTLIFASFSQGWNGVGVWINLEGSWFTIHCLVHWKQSWGEEEEDEELIPLPSADSSVSSAPVRTHLQMLRISRSNFPGVRLPLVFAQCPNRIQALWFGDLRAVFQANAHQIAESHSEHIQKPYVPEIYSVCKRKNIHCRFFSHNLTGFYCLSCLVRQNQSDTLTHSDFVQVCHGSQTQRL